MRRYRNSSSLLVADVDCTAGGKGLCQDVGVKGFPTVKYGDPEDLQDYAGGRDFEALERFAAALEGSCSAFRADACAEEERARMAEFRALGAEGRQAAIQEREAELARLEGDFQGRVDAINRRFEEAKKRKDAEVGALREGGLGLLRALRALERRGAKAA